MKDSLYRGASLWNFVNYNDKEASATLNFKSQLLYIGPLLVKIRISWYFAQMTSIVNYFRKHFSNFLKSLILVEMEDSFSFEIFVFPRLVKKILKSFVYSYLSMPFGGMLAHLLALFNLYMTLEKILSFTRFRRL